MISNLLLAVSLSMDAAAFALAYAVKNIRFTWGSRLIMAALSFGYAAIAVCAGGFLGRYISADVANWAGATLIAALGIMNLCGGFFKKPTPPSRALVWVIRPLRLTIHIMRDPAQADQNRSQVIEPHEALYLGFALSLDALAAGFGAGLAGLAGAWFPLGAALCQLVFLCFGEWIGKKAKPIIPKKLSQVLPGIILLGIAVWRVI